MSKTKKTVLYISYDGLTDPLGQSQVLSYMIGLSSHYRILIISCEKKEKYSQLKEDIAKQCSDHDINWYPIIYSKRPPILSTMYDVWRIQKKANQLCKKLSFDLVHCRSYIASIIGLSLKRNFGIPFIFDMRGFWIDEKIEAGQWPITNFLFKSVIGYFRFKEKQFYKYADAIVTLTYASREIIIKKFPSLNNKIYVIPTCVNLQVFNAFNSAQRAASRSKLGIPQDSFTLLYSGGFGPNYDIHFLLKIFERLQKVLQNPCLLILSKDGITGLEGRVDQKNIFTISLPYNQVSSFLMAGDLGVINYTNEFSVAGRSPTKLGEYWACGVPAVAPPGVGDVDELFKKYSNSGFIFNEIDFSNSLQLISSIDKSQLRRYANDYFNLNKGVQAYKAIYISICN